jgi:nickel/cobalt exporter
MRALNLGMLIAAGGLLLWLFGLGGMDLISHWAALQQREAQTALAAGLRAVRAGEPGAWITLMGVCASYGFFHAAGPGHGKLLIGGYGAAARVTALRLSTLAVISSLAQALTAIMLVGAGALVLGWSRARMTDTAEQVLAPASYGAIAMVGLWLAWRGLRRVRSVRAAAAVAEDGTCHSCGHAHGPSVDQVAGLTSWRDAVVIVVSVAMRPCTGAVFLLILCFGLGIPLAGIIGAMVMGLGTASVTVLVAILAVGTRRSALAGWSGSGAVRAIALIEIVAGAVIAVIATTLLAPFV